jgi:DNA-binding transcriptional MerR regulator
VSAPRPPRRRPAPAVRYKMKELTALTGVTRPVVHFYIQQGLLPAGEKTGRNTAFYGDEHVQRIRLIRRLQEERFLPLKAIKAVLDAEREAFTPAQRATLVEAMQRLGDSLKPAAGGPAPVVVDGLLAELGLDRTDLVRLDALGVLALAQDDRGRTVVRREDVWVLQFWGELRDAGFTPELGFGTDDLAIYVEAIEKFIRYEAGWLGRIVDKVSPERLAQMVDRGVPLIHSFLTRHHESKVRAFITTLDARRSP